MPTQAARMSTSNPVGRPGCQISEAWRLRFDLTERQMRLDSIGVERLLAQLSYCRSDEARRLILGTSQRTDSEV